MPSLVGTIISTDNAVYEYQTHRVSETRIPRGMAVTSESNMVTNIVVVVEAMTCLGY